nr:hypothetical protein [Angustibacter aerolatus]
MTRRRTDGRLLLVGVLVLSLLVTLVARLFTVQVLGAEGYAAAASTNREREIVTPAVRGLVLDDRGRPLVANRSALVVSVSRTTLLDSDDEGRALIGRLATVLGEPFDDVWGRTQAVRHEGCAAGAGLLQRRAVPAGAGGRGRRPEGRAADHGAARGLPGGDRRACRRCARSPSRSA